MKCLPGMQWVGGAEMGTTFPRLWCEWLIGIRKQPCVWLSMCLGGCRRRDRSLLKLTAPAEMKCKRRFSRGSGALNRKEQDLGIGARDGTFLDKLTPCAGPGGQVAVRGKLGSLWLEEKAAVPLSCWETFLTDGL